MPTKKRIAKRRRAKKTNTVIIIKTTIDPKDTLFPEKIAEGKEILRNCNFNGLI